MEITIKNRTITLKNKMRALLIYEQIAKKAFNPITITDMMLYFYSVILANEPDIDMTFSEFLDILDEQENLFETFNKWLLSINKKNEQFSDGENLKKNPIQQ